MHKNSIKILKKTYLRSFVARFLNVKFTPFGEHFCWGNGQALLETLLSLKDCETVPVASAGIPSLVMVPVSIDLSNLTVVGLYTRNGFVKEWICQRNI